MRIASQIRCDCEGLNAETVIITLSAKYVSWLRARLMHATSIHNREPYFHSLSYFDGTAIYGGELMDSQGPELDNDVLVETLQCNEWIVLPKDWGFPEDNDIRTELDMIEIGHDHIEWSAVHKHTDARIVSNRLASATFEEILDEVGMAATT